jgi:hypothetical protein
MNKKLIRLTESDLHRIIKETVKRVINETNNDVNTYVISNGYGSGKFTGTYEEAILRCLDNVNAMCTVWLYKGREEIGRTHKTPFYKGYLFASNVDGKQYVEINGKLHCINDE